MPNRIVCDAIYTSHKLKKVPAEYRAEYANLIPLAEVNGAFECDPELVWSKVYSFNRNDVTPDIVAKILDELEKAGMLERYEAGGKRYGYWIGIDKKGRLPGVSQLDRYDAEKLPPTPKNLQEPKDSKYDALAPMAYGETLDKPLGSHIVERCEQTIGFVEDRRFYQKELKTAIKKHGHDQVLREFNIWLSSVLPFSGRKPITSFIKSLDSTTTIKAQVSSPNLQEVETQIATISDNEVFFGSHHKPLVASLVSMYGKDEVINAFRDFWGRLDADENKAFAAKNFVDQAATRIEAVRLSQKQTEDTKSRVSASIEAARSQVESELEPEEIEEEL